MLTTVLHDILEVGVNEGASDWHIREGCPIGLRVDGRLVELDFVADTAFLEEAVQQIASESNRRTYAETGDADFAFEEADIGRFRANLHRQRGKIGITLRHVKGTVPNLEQLGLPPIVRSIAENKRGIVFVTGATGSGKSTTLACMIEHMNFNCNRHIITIEDPIEYAFVDRNCIIEQREVGLDAITFDSALIHALRQDPDVIVVGEMRHRGTFETALNASETGHLVMTTLHTTTAAQSIFRILDMFPHEERESVRISLATNLCAIICQRLVPRVTGKGVVPALEVMINTPLVRELLFNGELDKLQSAIEAGRREGMMSFNQCLLELVNETLISEEEALSTSNNPQQLEMNLKGIFLNSGGGGIVG